MDFCMDDLSIDEGLVLKSPAAAAAAKLLQSCPTL